MKTERPPQQIYLQFFDPDTGEKNHEITWCEHQIEENDVSYMLESRLQKAEKLIEKQAQEINENDETERMYQENILELEKKLTHPIFTLIEIADRECSCTEDQQSGKDYTTCQSCQAADIVNNIVIEIEQALKDLS